MMSNYCKLVDCGSLAVARGMCMKHYHKEFYKRRKYPIYDIWRNMIARCYDPNSTSYGSYGGRGITVCSRWLVGLPNKKPHKLFTLDMGPRPSENHSLERINNEDNYYPANCKWATQQEQCRNRRSNRMLTHDGQTRCMSEWAELLGVSKGFIHRRLANGWTIEAALTHPKKQNKYG